MISRLLVSLICTAVVVPSLPAAADEPLFSLMEKGLTAKDKGSDYALSERTAYGKSFERWLTAYSEGRKADASVEWGHVLSESKRARSLYELAGLVSRRLQFLEGKQSRLLEKRGGVMAALKNILEETQRQVGNCYWTATIADYIADRYIKTQSWKEAIVYAKRSALINQHLRVVIPQDVYTSVIALAQLQFNDHDFAAAKTNAELALAVATKAHAADGVSHARTLLSRIKTATMRSM